MNKLMKVLLPVFLLVSVFAQAKESLPVLPKIIGTWEAVIVYNQKKYSGSYSFSQNMTMFQMDNLASDPDFGGYKSTTGKGTWELNFFSSDAEKVHATYTKKLLDNSGNVVYIHTVDMFATVKGNKASGNLNITISKPNGGVVIQKITSIPISLQKIISVY